MSPTTVRQRQVHFSTPERPVAALTSATQLARMRMLSSSSPVRAVHPDEALTSPTAHRTQQPTGNREGLEDPFTAPNPIRSTPPGFQLSYDILGATTAKVVNASQRRYDVEMKVYLLVVDAFQDVCRNKITDADQLRLMEKATENLTDLWPALIGLDDSTLNLRKPHEPTNTTNATYATVAATAATPETRATAPKQQAPKAASGRPKKIDKRVLIRMPPESAAGLTVFNIKKHLADTLQLKATQLLDARKIRTGWSVNPDTVETQTIILSQQEKWLPALNAWRADKQETWYTFIVDNCPRYLRAVTGECTPLLDAAYDEIVTSAGQAPVNFHIRNKDDNSTPNAMLIVSFKNRQAAGWRLFGCSEKARLVTSRTTVAQCQNCWDFHQTVACARSACCKNCGSREHRDADNCNENPRCANCLGPHAADDRRCYARPKVVNGSVEKLSKFKRQTARRQGAQDYAAAKQNRATGPPETEDTTNQTQGSTAVQPDVAMETDAAANPPATATDAGLVVAAPVPLPQHTTTLVTAQFHGINSQATSIYTDALTSPVSPAGSPAKRKRLTQTTELTDEQAKQIRQSTRPTKEQVSLLKPQYRPGHVRSTARSATRSTANRSKSNA